MSAKFSYLTSSHYGYDFVVATTQVSINATMDEYINGLDAPEVTMCYVMDDQGNPQWIDYNDLLSLTKGTDPFAVPNGAPTTSQDVQNLAQAYFMYAFKAQIGIPPGYAPLTPKGPPLPDIVTLGMNTASVTYNLLCSEFTVVEATYGPRGIVSWLNLSQQPSSAWIFTSKVDLRLSPNSAYSNLPPSVQNAIKNLGGYAFSIQQLLFDLDNAALQTIPTISGVAPGTPLYNALQTVFIGAYFSQLREKGEPVLAYAVKQSALSDSTLVLTDLNMEINPYMGSNGQPLQQPDQSQQDAATLCYLCATNGANLPVPSPFSWNWVDLPEISQYEGVVAINRNAFVRYLEKQLYPSITSNCYLPNAHVWLDGKCYYKGKFTGYQTPTIIYPPSGATVLQFSYSASSSDQAGLNGDIGQLELLSSYNATVQFIGNQIIIQQHLVLYLRIQSLASSESGNVFDKTLTDTFTLAVDQNGRLSATLTTAPVDDKSVALSANWFINFFTGLNDLLENFENWEKSLGSAHFQDIPLNFAQNFIFPGGKTFTFQSVFFSTYQDLISHITYAQPN